MCCIHLGSISLMISVLSTIITLKKSAYVLFAEINTAVRVTSRVSAVRVYRVRNTCLRYEHCLGVPHAHI